MEAEGPVFRTEAPPVALGVLGRGRPYQQRQNQEKAKGGDEPGGAKLEAGGDSAGDHGREGDEDHGAIVDAFEQVVDVGGEETDSLQDMEPERTGVTSPVTDATPCAGYVPPEMGREAGLGPEERTAVCACGSSGVKGREGKPQTNLNCVVPSR